MQKGLTMWPSGRQPDTLRTQLELLLSLLLLGEVFVGQLSWAAVTAATLGGLSRIFGACYRRISRQRQDVATH